MIKPKMDLLLLQTRSPQLSEGACSSSSVSFAAVTYGDLNVDDGLFFIVKLEVFYNNYWNIHFD